MAENDLEFDEANASALAEMMVDPTTSEAVRLQIINDILEATGDNTFFETMFKEMLSFGKCAFCKHENHWLIPEEDMAQMGWVTMEKDKNVRRHTSIDDCPEFAEACTKKKTTT